jgi:small subunit ribosomal protein S20
VANIKQQIKRNRRSLQQRERNLRYRSTIKTLFRRLDDAAENGDGDQVGSRARELEHLIDRAAAEGVIHRNNAARKKSRVARIAQRVTTGSTS